MARLNAPWAQSAIRLQPAGLRDAVLRRVYSPESWNQRGRPKAGTLFAAVTDWSRGIDCTPEQWAELTALIAARDSDWPEVA